MIGGFWFSATVDRVIDGDTVDVKTGDLVVRVRLVDCWAPETRTRDAVEKRLGMMAADRLREALPVGSPVRVDVGLKVDGDFSDWLTFGRVVGAVSVDPESVRVDVGSLLVGLGLAGKTKADCRALVQAAKDEGGEL